MTLKSHFFILVILILVVNLVHCRWTVKNENRKTIWKSSRPSGLVNKHRVKREWDYPTVSIVESRYGAPFTPKNLLNVSSSNVNAYRYYFADNPPAPAVSEGIFTITTIFDKSRGNKVGKITQQLPVDRESVSQYTFQVGVQNEAGQPVEENVEITINVIDVNDNRPVFQEPSLFGEVSEATPIGVVFMRIRATDLDDPETNGNGNVHYTYVGEEEPKTDSPRFAVSTSGDVSLLSPLDRESVPRITFVVKALDGYAGFDSGSLSVTATATVVVLDSNDHAPVFTQSNYATTVGELLPVQSSIITVGATDDDIGANAAVYFRIGSGNVDGKFSVVSYPNADGESTGQIVLAKPLDFETGDTNFVLTVIAYNKNASNSAEYESTAEVTVTVLDENEPPVFLNQPYRGNVRENRNDTIQNVVTVKAVDYDFGGTQSVTYSLENPKGWFEIDQNGVISAIAPIDRENPAVNQETSIYTLMVKATDDFTERKFSTAPVEITIGDVNDNAPEPANVWETTLCENPTSERRTNVTTIHIMDRDSANNGPEYDISIGQENTPFILENLSPATGAIVMTTQKQFDASEQDTYNIPIVMVDTASAGENRMTSTHTLVIKICSCNDQQEPSCDTAVPIAAGFPVAVLIAIIAAILILLIIVLAVVAYKRRHQGELEKQALFYDEDDVRENLQAYHDEGGGEEDNDGYDISALQAPPLIAPKRQDEPPLGGAQPQPRSRVPPDTDIGDYINDAKQQADNDPTAPPFDSLLVFDYEGQGSDAGSLSSLNSGTTDASQDYDYLNNWGPRFKKLADMYGGGESD